MPMWCNLSTFVSKKDFYIRTPSPHQLLAPCLCPIRGCLLLIDCSVFVMLHIGQTNQHFCLVVFTVKTHLLIFILQTRRRYTLIQENLQQMPRNASDSRLAQMSNHPTNLKLCDKCQDVNWIREIGTQTELFDSLQKPNHISIAQPWGKHASTGIFDV